MMIKVNCKSFVNNGCDNKNVPRSLFGVGYRLCCKLGYPPKLNCEHQEQQPRPSFFSNGE